MNYFNDEIKSLLFKKLCIYKFTAVLRGKWVLIDSTFIGSSKSVFFTKLTVMF